MSEPSWTLLPPSYRPLVLALSAAIVGFAVWERTHPPQEAPLAEEGWIGDKVPIKTAEEAPAPQADVSGSLAAAATESYEARSEEERSALNERFYQRFEDEKKRLGIRILDKGAPDDEAAAVAVGSPPPPSAPAPKILVLKTAEALQAAWAAAGLSDSPPTVAFPGDMALFLVGPPGSGIVSAAPRRHTLTVRFRESGFASPSARIKAVPASALVPVLKPAP